MRIIFLGTNGWWDTKTGNTICTLIESEKYYVILDAGNGIYRAGDYIKDRNKKIYLILSHFHIDHIVGLHILPKFKNFRSLDVFFEKGKKKLLNRFKSPPFSSSFKKLHYPVRFRELKIGDNNIPFKINCARLDHPSSALGFRIYLDNKVISHCIDTATCSNCEKLAKSTDVLIHECSGHDNKRTSMFGHSGPKGAAKIAKNSKAKKLILTHFSADLYPTLKDRQKALKRAKKVFKDTIIAKDGMMINV